MLWVLSLSVSIIACIMAIVLFKTGFKENDRKSSRNILIWAVLFLGASFGCLEWSFYLLGYNMFTFFAFPLVAYFAIWFGFIIWLFEARGERKIWMIFLLALIIITVIAFSCMNCLASYALA